MHQSCIRHMNNYEHIHCVLILMNVCVTKPEMFLSSLHQRQNWRNHRSSIKLTFTWRNIMQFLQPDIVHSTMAIELRESRGAGSSKSSQTNSSAGAASSAVAMAFSVFINVHSRSLNGNIWMHQSCIWHMNNYEHIHCVLILMNVCVTKPEMFLSSLHQRQNWRNHRSSMKLTFTWRNIMQFLQPDIVHSTMAIELRESRGAGSSKSSQTNSSAGAASSAVAVAFSVFINVHSRSLNGNI